MTVVLWYIPYAHGSLVYIAVTNTHVTFVGGTYPGGIVSPIDLSMYTVWLMNVYARIVLTLVMFKT